MVNDRFASFPPRHFIRSYTLYMYLISLLNWFIDLSWKTSVFIRLWPLREKSCSNLPAEILPPPDLKICSNLPLQIYWNLPAEMPPHQFADLLKSATADLLKSACRNTLPPVCRFAQICHCRFTEICQQKYPPGLQICSNLPLQIYWNLLTEIPPPPAHFAHLFKSASWGHLHKRHFICEGNYLVNLAVSDPAITRKPVGLWHSWKHGVTQWLSYVN